MCVSILKFSIKVCVRMHKPRHIILRRSVIIKISKRVLDLPKNKQTNKYSGFNSLEGPHRDDYLFKVSQLRNGKRTQNKVPGLSAPWTFHLCSLLGVGKNNYFYCSHLSPSKQTEYPLLSL